MYTDYGNGDEDDYCSPTDSICSEFSMDESFLRKLFKACDTDNDGYLDRYVRPYLPCLCKFIPLDLLPLPDTIPSLLSLSLF